MLENKILIDTIIYQKMAEAHNPYGDGTAVEQIIERLTKG